MPTGTSWTTESKTGRVRTKVTRTDRRLRRTSTGRCETGAAEMVPSRLRPHAVGTRAIPTAPVAPAAAPEISTAPAPSPRTTPSSSRFVSIWPARRTSLWTRTARGLFSALLTELRFKMEGLYL
uniref:(northern house mosquito) hypothetical protein n=1 Tax=Culex pipiens TaxID=7175 RepID=A0A8D8ADT7_CULPI